MQNHVRTMGALWRNNPLFVPRSPPGRPHFVPQSQKSTITNSEIEALHPDKPREICVGEVKNLYLVVRPGGMKSWAVRYRLAGRSSLTLGHYPEVSIAAAIVQAKVLLAYVTALKSALQASKVEAREVQREASRTPRHTYRAKDGRFAALDEAQKAAA